MDDIWSRYSKQDDHHQCNSAGYSAGYSASANTSGKGFGRECYAQHPFGRQIFSFPRFSITRTASSGNVMLMPSIEGTEEHTACQISPSVWTDHLRYSKGGAWAQWGPTRRRDLRRANLPSLPLNRSTNSLWSNDCFTKNIAFLSHYSAGRLCSNEHRKRKILR